MVGWQGFRPRGAHVPLPLGPPRLGACPDPPDGRGHQGRRDPGAPPATGRPPPSSPSSPLLLVGPGARRHAGETGAAGAVGSLPRHARDDPSLASRPRAPSLDLPAPTGRTSI